MDTIVLIPGYMCDQSMWSNQLDILKKKYKVIIPQLNKGDSIENLKKYSQTTSRKIFSNRFFNGRVCSIKNSY